MFHVKHQGLKGDAGRRETAHRVMGAAPRHER